MRNWLVGRRNEVYRIVNAHNWPCLVKYNKCTWALRCEPLQASLRIVGAVMSMCAFTKKLSLSNMQEDLKSWSNFSSSAYLNQKSRTLPSSLCSLCLVLTTFGIFNEDFLESPGSERSLLYFPWWGLSAGMNEVNAVSQVEPWECTWTP